MLLRRWCDDVYCSHTDIKSNVYCSYINIKSVILITIILITVNLITVISSLFSLSFSWCLLYRLLNIFLMSSSSFSSTREKCFSCMSCLSTLQVFFCFNKVMMMYLSHVASCRISFNWVMYIDMMFMLESLWSASRLYQYEKNILCLHWLARERLQIYDLSDQIMSH